jgi:hypothetical protein
MVLFTLTGLNVDVGLYEFIEYPTYDFPDISASYYLDLSFNPVYFDNIFYFKTTAPDLLDFNNNVRVIFNSNGTPINSNSDAKGDIGDIWISEYPITYATDRFSEMGGNDSFFGGHLEKQKKPEDFKLRAEQLHGRLLTTSEMINYLNSTLDGATQLKSRTGIDSVNNDTANRYICTFNPPQDSYSEGVFEFVRVSDLNVFTATTNPNLFNGTNSDNRAALVYYTDYYDYDPDGPTILKDMAFKCESSNWPDISFSEGVISNYVRSDITNYLPPPSAAGVNYNKNIGVQWLTRNITGGYNNSDLFANEEALVQQYVTLDGPSQTVVRTFYSKMIRNSYKYYRLIFPSINPNAGALNSWDHRVGIGYIKIYNKENISNTNNISASTSYSPPGSAGWSVDTLTIYNVNHGNSWFSGTGGDYDDNTGVYNSSSPSTTYTTDLTIAGEWLQWEHDEEIIISNFVLYTGGSGAGGARGSPPGRIVLAGSNNLSNNWNILYDKTYPFEIAEYSIIFEDSIKTLIKSTLDVSGGTDAAPLSNADVGRNNVSREALLHLLDNDVSANVQRVHNMIAKAQTNVDSDGNDISFGDTSNLWIPIEFYDGDTIKFKLIYKPDQITNGSGVAVDDSGNALGTNIIEDQDYVVRLNIVGNRSDLFLRSSFLSDLDTPSNNFSGNELVDHIASRNSYTSVTNDTTLHSDNNFGSYVKIGASDTSYNYYEWRKVDWKKNSANSNWVYSTIRQNSTTGSNIYFTWIYRLHDGGYNQSIETRPSYNPTTGDWDGTFMWTPTQSGRIDNGGNSDMYGKWLIDPQKYAPLLSDFYDSNKIFTFGFFNGAYHMGQGDSWDLTNVVLSNMNSNTENNWRVLTLAVTEYNDSPAILLYENGIFLGSMGGIDFLATNSNTELFSRTDTRYGNARFIIGLMTSLRENSRGKDPSQQQVSLKKSLPYDLALWEAHEELSNGVNVSFKATQIYSDYVNKYKYDFINGVSTA